MLVVHCTCFYDSYKNISHVTSPSVTRPRPVRHPRPNRPHPLEHLRHQPVEYVPYQPKCTAPVVESTPPSTYEEKNKLTRKFIRYCAFIRDHFKDTATFVFLFCGSDGDKSKQTVLDEGFTEENYIEFDQSTVKGDVNTIIEKKYEFLYEYALKKYNCDFFVSTGSSDFIPPEAFSTMLEIHDEPRYYELSRIGDNGILCLKTDCDMYVYDKSVLKKSTYYLEQNLGGITACNKKCLEKLGFQMKLTKGNENIFINQCINVGSNCIIMGNFFLNYKVKQCETHSTEECQELFTNHIDIPEYIKKFSDFIDTI